MLFCAIIFCVSPEYSEYEIPAKKQPVCGFPDGGNQAETVPATEKTVIRMLAFSADRIENIHISAWRTADFFE